MLMKILNTELAGQTFELKKGENILGRSPECDIVLLLPGISKKHASIVVRNDEVLVTDLRSSNGTTVNGVRILKKEVRPNKDKVSFHQVIVEFVTPMVSNTSSYQDVDHPSTITNRPMNGSLALQANLQTSNALNPEIQNTENLQPLEVAKKYVDEVVLAGVYKLFESFKYNQVLFLFIFGFVLLSTFLAVMPMISLTKSSVEQESQRRALTIARNLAISNQTALQQNLETAVSIRAAEKEEGVQVALILSSKDGHVIAPTANLGSYPNLPFVHKARKQSHEIVEQIDDELIGASVPIQVYHPQLGPQVIAYSMVLYNMGAIAIDSSRYVSLAAQIFALMLFAGFILYLLLMKSNQQIMKQLAFQLDEAITSDSKNISSKYQVDYLDKVILNINTLLLNRGNQNTTNTTDPLQAIVQVASLSTSPILIIDSDNVIQSLNPATEDLLGMREIHLKNQSLESISDESLKISIQDLIAQLEVQPMQPAIHTLNFLDVSYQIEVSRLQFSSPTHSYYLVSFKKMENEFL